MKRFLIIPVLILLVAVVVYPQKSKDEKITKIREFYTSISKEIENIENSEDAAVQSELAVNELVVNKLSKSWPAVGNYSVVYRFYYKLMGEKHFPDHLVKVSVKTESAAREMYKELVFDDNGELMFFFENSDAEHRLYFEDGKILDYAGSGDETYLAALEAGARVESARLKRLFELSIE